METAAQGGAQTPPALPAQRRTRARKLPFRRDISERPAEARERKRAGHWEGDLINGAGGGGHLVSMIEKCARYTLLARVGSKDAVQVPKQMSGTARRVDKELFKTLFKTLRLDNGKEFAQHRGMERDTGAKVYFATPYHSWERGSNENVNGLIRSIPKAVIFRGWTQRNCDTSRRG